MVLIFSPNCVAAALNLLVISWMSSKLMVTKAESSAKRRSLTHISSTSKAAGNIKSKFKKNKCAYLLQTRAPNYWYFRLGEFEYFLCQAFHAFPREIGAYILTFCIADRFTPR